MSVDEIIKELESLGSKKNVEGMQRFGITSRAKILGVSKPELREIAKKIGKNQELSIELWESGIHEARILACMIADPEKFTDDLMDRWVSEIDNWDLCDQCAMNLFWKTKHAYKKAMVWCQSDCEFTKRAGFALMAKLAISDKKADDRKFEQFFPIIKREASDNRNYVKKAVSWALRQIGKRNPDLNKKAIETAKEIQKINSRSAKWIASDAIRELTSEAVQERFKKRGK
ncbi:putative DNA alkylation repair enzyme [Archaeoglobus sulfaticallidus PM70-1]|uniref:Putative DNA alkylation repair enzyme n=1 Tax=Archaeoglobus sulfaticallidus PM70-1 TaxID=387631 RepID=N0BDJ8_9EURY|nr:DNA alkylation repair protein [Archaeoglobus sulfaticallidus]AGK61709.1 putative DNA alkylation repair enzyme [Archaeoglobus sulfaticallidus PM70-1]